MTENDLGILFLGGFRCSRCRTFVGSSAEDQEVHIEWHKSVLDNIAKFERLIAEISEEIEKIQTGVSSAVDLAEQLVDAEPRPETEVYYTIQFRNKRTTDEEWGEWKDSTYPPYRKIASEEEALATVQKMFPHFLTEYRVVKHTVEAVS